MFEIYFSFDGRITPEQFRKHIAITSLIGTVIAYAITVFFYGSYTLPFVPLVERPDPSHQMLYTLIPFALSAPLFVKRFHDRDRSAALLLLFFIMIIGSTLIHTVGIFTTDGMIKGPLDAYVARHIVQVPMCLFGIWLLIQCSHYGGSEGYNNYGPAPAWEEK